MKALFCSLAVVAMFALSVVASPVSAGEIYRVGYSSPVPSSVECQAPVSAVSQVEAVTVANRATAEARSIAIALSADVQILRNQADQLRVLLKSHGIDIDQVRKIDIGNGRTFDANSISSNPISLIDRNPPSWL